MRFKGIISIVSLVAVVVLAFVGRSVYKHYHVPPISERYQLAEVSRGDITSRIVANGTLNPVTIVNVGTQVSGTVLKLYVDYNDHVKKDQIIAELDPRVYQAQVNQTQANLESARANQALATTTEERNENLFKQDFISRQDLDQAVQSRKAATAQVKALEAQLSRDQSNLGYSVIKAPVSGVVMSRAVSIGQTVAASFQTPTLFTIAEDLSKMQIESAVPEADIGQLKEGQRATFSVDAYPNDKFTGTLRQVRINPTTAQNVVTYTVVVNVENPGGKLLPGMTALLNIIIDERKDVLRVPSAALAYKPKFTAEEIKKMREQAAEGAAGKSGETAASPSGGAAGQVAATPEQREQFAAMRRASGRGSVFVPDQKENRVQPVRVKAGLSDGEQTEILSGDLKVGDEVVVGEKKTEVANAAANANAMRMMGGPGLGGGRGPR